MRYLLFLVFFSITNYSEATTIIYEASNIAGNQWQYSYSLTNDSLSVDIEEFIIYFDVNSFSNIQISSTPNDWDPLVFQPDTSLPDDGYYDALALASGIAPNTSLSGFIVQFDYLLSDIPGSQFFEIRDSQSFALLDSGTSVKMPEPNSLFSLILGIGLMFVSNRKRFKS